MIGNNEQYSEWQILVLFPYHSRSPPRFHIRPTPLHISANDIATKITKSKSIFYADDTVLFTHGKNIDEIEKSLQNDLDSLHTWCSDKKKN